MTFSNEIHIRYQARRSHPRARSLETQHARPVMLIALQLLHTNFSVTFHDANAWHRRLRVSQKSSKAHTTAPLKMIIPSKRASTEPLNNDPPKKDPRS